jgi:benzoylformate decarboxylase
VNGGYRIIRPHLLGFPGNSHFIGMDVVDPRIDFSGRSPPRARSFSTS